MQLPKFVTPEQLAQHLGWSPRRLRQLARELGACRLSGNRMILLEADVDAIMAATKLPPTESPKTTTAQNEDMTLLNTDYEDLLKLRNSQKKPRKHN